MNEIIIKANSVITSNFKPLAGMNSKVKRKRAYIVPATPQDATDLIEQGIQLYTPDKKKNPDGKAFFIIPFSEKTTVVNEQTKKIHKVEFKDELNANFSFEGLDLSITIVPESNTNPKRFARVTAMHILTDTVSKRLESNPFGVNMEEYETIQDNNMSTIEFEETDGNLFLN